MNIKKVKCRRQLIKRTIVSLSLSTVSHLDENYWDRFKSTCSPENLEEKKIYDYWTDQNEIIWNFMLKNKHLRQTQKLPSLYPS